MIDRRRLLASTAGGLGLLALPAFARTPAQEPGPRRAARGLYDSIFEAGLQASPIGATGLGLDVGERADLKARLDKDGDGTFESHKDVITGLNIATSAIKGAGGIWVMNPDGRHVGTIKFPEQAVNFAFGSEDLRTLFCCAYTSVYTLRVKVPGQPHPWYRVRKR